MSPRSKNSLTVLGALVSALSALAFNLSSSDWSPWLNRQSWYSPPKLIALVVILVAAGIIIALRLNLLGSDWEPGTPAGDARHKLNRKWMLDQFRREWIDRALNQSLYQLARIDLGLEDRPDLIDSPISLYIQEANRKPELLPKGTKLISVFDAHAGTLQILGAPGSGKTTLLFELARDLVTRAEKDETLPMPVVFNLSSWAAGKRPELAEWLAAELKSLHDVPKKLAPIWIKNDQILPLLDGLDEVVAEYRQECVAKIAGFRAEHGLLPLVIASRTVDFEALAERPRVKAAVLIQPLTRPQAENFLKKAAFKKLRALLAEDPALWELLDTPLMLDVALGASGNMDPQQVLKGGSKEERRGNLFAAYVDAMFKRRGQASKFTREQTLTWLRWLAQSMARLGQSEFHLEKLNRKWVTAPLFEWVRLTLYFLPGAVFGWLTGDTLPVKVAVVLVCGFGSLLYSQATEPVQSWRWSWRTFFTFFPMTFMTFFAFAVWYQGDFIGPALPLRLARCFTLSLAIGSVMSLATSPAAGGTAPNQGTWRSGKTGLLAGLIFSSLTTTIQLLATGPTEESLVPIFFGLMLGFMYGGAFFLNHWSVRLALWKKGYAPFQYVEFLDYAASRIFLRKAGGGYTFAHRMLLEYFAALPASQPEPAKSIAAAR